MIFSIICSYIKNSFGKTLTILNLHYNKIDADGAKHLANALKVNQVRLQGVSPSAFPVRYLLTDSHYVDSLRKSNWMCCYSRGFGWHAGDQSGCIIPFPLYLFIIVSSFHRQWRIWLWTLIWMRLSKRTLLQKHYESIRYNSYAFQQICHHWNMNIRHSLHYVFKGMEMTAPQHCY